MSKSLKIGLIGIGNMGGNHIRVLSILKSVDCKFIYDLDKDKLESYSKKYLIKASENLEDDLKTIEAIIIASPTHTHFHYITLCSKYVKNIFVEKPLTDSLENTLKIQDLAKKNNLNIQIGFIERFNPAVIELKKVLELYSKNIINIDFTRANKISSRIKDVDVIMDLMTHDIDLALYLNGHYEKIVSYGYMENKMIVFARATIFHKNGRFSNIVASRVTQKRIRQINVTADNMYINCNLLRKEILINKQDKKSDYADISIISTEETINVPPQEALLGEIIAFIEFAISNKSDNSNIPKISSSKENMEITNTIQKQIMQNIQE